MKITTNGHSRELVPLVNVPAKEHEWFDYIEGDDAYSPRLFEYRGSWYDLSEFMPTSRNRIGGVELSGWDGVQTQSAFDAVVVRYPKDDWDGRPDFERVVVGHATW